MDLAEVADTPPTPATAGVVMLVGHQCVRLRAGYARFSQPAVMLTRLYGGQRGMFPPPAASLSTAPPWAAAPHVGGS